MRSLAVILALVVVGCSGRKAADANARGSKCFDRGDLPCALVAFREAVSAEPEDPTYRNAYGAALAKSGRIDQAISEFEAALRLDPGMAKASDNLARAQRVREYRRAALIADEMQARTY